MSSDDDDEGQVLAERLRSFAAGALGAEWRVVASLPGGYQQGALEVRRRDGLGAVFKPAAGDRADLELKAAAVGAARRRGWPVAEWTLWGVHDGAAWYLQRLAQGRAIERLNPSLEASIVAAVDRQADVPVLPTFDWSRHMLEIAHVGSDWHQRCQVFGGKASELATMLAAKCRSIRDPNPPSVDLVHGDFATDNILEHEGSLTIIDTQSVGRGSRAVDLATMSVHCLAWDQGSDSAERLFGAARDVAGPVVMRYVAGRALGAVVFSMEHYAGFVNTMATRLLSLEAWSEWV